MSTQAPPAWYEACSTDGWRCGHHHALPSNAARCLARAAEARTRNGMPADPLVIADQAGRPVITRELAQQMADTPPELRTRLIGGPWDGHRVHPVTGPCAAIVITDHDARELHLYSPLGGGAAKWGGCLSSVVVRTPELA